MWQYTDCQLIGNLIKMTICKTSLLKILTAIKQVLATVWVQRRVWQSITWFWFCSYGEHGKSQKKLLIRLLCGVPVVTHAPAAATVLIPSQSHFIRHKCGRGGGVNWVYRVKMFNFENEIFSISSDAILLNKWWAGGKDEDKEKHEKIMVAGGFHGRERKGGDVSTWWSQYGPEITVCVTYDSKDSVSRNICLDIRNVPIAVHIHAADGVFRF